ncbi:unnamed protein product, partial [Staurois parvus]
MADYRPGSSNGRPVICYCFRIIRRRGWQLGSEQNSRWVVSIATLCHVPLSGLLTHCWCPESVMGPCTASHCCCLHRHTLPCATFRSPH